MVKREETKMVRLREKEKNGKVETVWTKEKEKKW